MRELEFLVDTQCTLLMERRRFTPYGLQGGGKGKKEKTLLIRNGRTLALPGKASLSVQAGERIRVETAGGGGFGRKKFFPGI